MTAVGAARVPSRRLIGWLAPQRWRLLAGAALGALAIGCGVALLATSAWLISRASEHPPVLYLQVAIVAVRAFGIGRGVFRYAERLVSHEAAFRALSGLRIAVYERLAVVAPAGVPAYRRGDLLERLVRDVDATQDLPLRVLLPYASGTVVAAGSVLLAWWLLPAAGLVMLVWLLLAATLVPWLTARAAARGEALAAAARGQEQADVLAMLDGLADIRAAGATDAWLGRVGAATHGRARLAARSVTATALAALLGILLSGAAVVAMILVAVPAVVAGSLPGVELAVLVLLPLGAVEAVSALPAAALAFGRVRGAAARVVAVLDAPDPVPDPVARQPLARTATPPVLRRCCSVGPEGSTRTTSAPSLRVRGLRARWPSGPPVLHGFDLDLAPGERVALVGPSGSGKSTLLSVLAKFLPYEGSVTLDGIELRDLDGDTVRSVVGWCPQSPYVFDTSVTENVRLARPGCPDTQVRSAVEAVGLGDWVDGLPDGMATRVGENGARMSGGQRQRLGVARILLAGHPVVLLDEPTEHLDEPTAQRVATELLTVLADRSVLWVAHRPHGLAAMDRTVELAPRP